MNASTSTAVKEHDVIVGEGAARRAFVAAHCDRLLEWFAEDGRFIHPGVAPTTRERLWNAQSLLAHGGERQARLADAIIRTTPVDENQFEPVIAAELMLRFDASLGRDARAHLEQICHAHLLNILEVRFANAAVNNFSAMTTWFLAAAGQVLDRYRPAHPLSGIDAIYNGTRLRMIGRNAMRALTAAWSADQLSNEFNSPTYTPITLHALASTAALIKDHEVAEAARRLERELWRETLAFYHPHLETPCGPFSRAYRVDLLGQNSIMRLLMSALELSNDPPIEQLLETDDEDVVFHHHGDVPFCWAQPAWVTTGTYQLPADALATLQSDVLSRRTERALTWPAKGRIDTHNQSIVPVQGDALPGGEGRVIQEQRPLWALGYRSRAGQGQTYPMHFHYALTDPPRPRLQRHVTIATMFHSFTEPVPEFAFDADGRPVEPDNFNHYGHVEVTPTAGGLAFEARPLEALATLPVCELSLNSLIPLHFRAPQDVRINDRPWTHTAEALSLNAREATLRIEDHGFDFEITYQWLGRPGTFRLMRWCRFIRFAALLEPDEPEACIRGELRLIRTADGAWPSWMTEAQSGATSEG